VFAYFFRPPIAVGHLRAEAPRFTMDALLNELAFQKVLLSSIDDTVQNRETAEEEVRAEIQSLEKQIRVLKRGTTTTTTSNSRSSASSQPSQTQFSDLSKTSDPATGDGLSAVSAMDGYLSECLASSTSNAHSRLFECPFLFWNCVFFDNPAKQFLT
jgi:hypothetical protein